MSIFSSITTACNSFRSAAIPENADILEAIFSQHPEKFEDSCKAMFGCHSVSTLIWDDLSDDVKAELLRLGYKPKAKPFLREFGKSLIDVAKDNAVDALNKRFLKDVPFIGKENEYTLKLGDVVRDANGYYMVVRPKSEKAEGVLAALKIKPAVWCFRFTYREYEIMSFTWYYLEEAACNRVDGRVNTSAILNRGHAPGNEGEQISSNRDGIYFYPAFDFVKRMGEDIYIPAIEELYDIFSRREVLPKLNERLQEYWRRTIASDVDVLIWSSTDNRSNLARGGEALALLLRPGKHIIVQSVPKDKEAIVLPLRRF